LTRGRVDGLLGVVAAARLRNQDPHREVDRDAQTPKKREDDEHDAHDVGVNVESFGDATGDTPTIRRLVLRRRRPSRSTSGSGVTGASGGDVRPSLASGSGVIGGSGVDVFSSAARALHPCFKCTVRAD